MRAPSGGLEGDGGEKGGVLLEGKGQYCAALMTGKVAGLDYGRHGRAGGGWFREKAGFSFFFFGVYHTVPIGLS